MLFKKDEWRLLWPFYVMYFFLGLSNILDPYIIIYFRELGYSFFQIAILTGGFAFGVILFEIPTGIFADLKSRKLSVFIGFTILGSAIILIPFVHSFILNLVLWFVAGLGVTFISGADEAWRVDNLKYARRKDLVQESFIKVQVIAGIGFIIGPLVSIVVVQYYSLKWVWVISGLCVLIGGIFVFFNKEIYTPRKKQGLSTFSLRKLFITSLKKASSTFKLFLRKRPLFLILLGGIFTAMMVMTDNAWQPLLTYLSLPTPYLGLVYAILGVVMIVSAFIPRYLERFNIQTSMSILIFVDMIVLLSLLFVAHPFFIFGALIFIAHMAMLRPSYNTIIETYFHKHVPSSIRATAGSVKNMMLSMAALLVTLFGGILIDYLGPLKAIVVSAIFGVLAIATYLQLKSSNF
ncbi:MAG: MFS transporter [Candidatus Woesearchaeota archaeon]